MESLMLVLVLVLEKGLGQGQGQGQGPELELGLGLALKVLEQDVHLMRRHFYPSCSSVRHNRIRHKTGLRNNKE